MKLFFLFHISVIISELLWYEYLPLVSEVVLANVFLEYVKLIFVYFRRIVCKWDILHFCQDHLLQILPHVLGDEFLWCVTLTSVLNGKYLRRLDIWYHGKARVFHQYVLVILFGRRHFKNKRKIRLNGFKHRNLD